MNKLKIFITLVFTFSASIQAAIISGKIETSNGKILKDIEIGIYPLITYDGMGNLKYPLYISKSDMNGNFYIESEPGVYTLSISKKGFDPIQFNFFILNNDIRISINALLSNTEGKSRFKMKGFPDKEQFEQTLMKIHEIEIQTKKIGRNSSSPSFDDIINKLNELVSSTTQPIKNFVLSKKFEVYSYRHPISDILSNLSDSLKLNQNINLDSVKEYIIGCYNILEKIDIRSPLVDINKSHFISCLADLHEFINNTSIDNDHWPFDNSYFIKQAHEITEKSRSNYTRSIALFQIARYYYLYNPPRAIPYIEKYKVRYPKSDNINKVTSYLKDLSLIPGKVAPDFKVETLDGDSIHLKEFKGKFVFIMFGTIDCPHCTGEIPNLNKLHEEISNHQLEVVEIFEYPRYKKEQYISYVKANKISYKVALENRKIGLDYSIPFMPLMYLIGPDGKIISRNSTINMRLRGKGLVDEVRKEIEKYNKEL